MKTRFPLSLKILSWLGINLGLILGLGALVFGVGGGVGDWMRGPVSGRLQLLGDAVASELSRNADIAVILDEYQQTYDLRFAVYSAEGELWGGDELALPQRVQHWLGAEREGPARFGEPPPRRNPGDSRPPPRVFGGEPPPRAPPLRAEPGRQAPPVERGAGRIMDKLGDSPRWWGAVRIPIYEVGRDRPRSGALVAVSESAWGFGRLLDLRPMVYAVGAVMVFSILFWLPLVMRMTASLRSMANATQAIAEGRFDTRVPTDRADEIGALGESINRMAGRLDTLVNGQRKFLADMAHELGSPLGRLQVASSILEERVADELQPQVADVREEVEQMSELLAELLAFTKVGLQMREARLQPVVVRDVIEEAIVREAGASEVARLGLDDLVVNGDARLLVKVMSNLVRNAVRYGGNGVRIEVEARRGENGMVRLVIRDNGPGVPTDALARLGEPFFRPDAARSRQVGGTGLGLSIVRQSVSAMRGRVAFANISPHGFVVTIELPEVTAGEFTPA